MKKILVLIVGILIVACARESEQTTIKEREIQSTKENNQKFKLEKEYRVGDFILSFKDVYVTDATTDDKAMVFEYDFKNEADFITSPYHALSMKAYQDGKMTKDSIAVEGIDFDKETDNLEQGETLESGYAVVAVKSLDRPIEIHIQNLYDPGENPLVFTIEYPSQYEK